MEFRAYNSRAPLLRLILVFVVYNTLNLAQENLLHGTIPNEPYKDIFLRGLPFLENKWICCSELQLCIFYCPYLFHAAHYSEQLFLTIPNTFMHVQKLNPVACSTLPHYSTTKKRMNWIFTLE